MSDAVRHHYEEYPYPSYPLRIIPCLGHRPPPVGRRERGVLCPFVQAVSWEILSPAVQAATGVYVKAFFLLKFRP